MGSWSYWTLLTLAKQKYLERMRRLKVCAPRGILCWCDQGVRDDAGEWSAEQVTKITEELINLEFLPTATNVDRGVLNQEFVLQQMDAALTTLTSYDANDIVANSRKNSFEAWRRLQKRYDRRQEEESDMYVARSFLLEGGLCRNSKQELNGGSPICRALRRI